MNDLLLNCPMVLTKDAQWMKDYANRNHQPQAGEVILLPEDAILVAIGEDKERIRLIEKPILISKA